MGQGWTIKRNACGVFENRRKIDVQSITVFSHDQGRRAENPLSRSMFGNRRVLSFLRPISKHCQGHYGTTLSGQRSSGRRPPSHHFNRTQNNIRIKHRKYPIRPTTKYVTSFCVLTTSGEGGGAVAKVVDRCSRPAPALQLCTK